MNSPAIVGDAVHHRASQGDVTVEVTTSNAWQNPFSEMDVDRSGSVTTLDALLIINFIAANGSGAVTQPSSQSELPVAYYDTTGESSVSTLDALRVINTIAQQPQAAGEQIAAIRFESRAPSTPSEPARASTLASQVPKIVGTGSKAQQQIRDLVFSDLGTQADDSDRETTDDRRLAWAVMLNLFGSMLRAEIRGS